MTAGTRTIGSQNQGQFYYARVDWFGQDGKYSILPNGLKSLNRHSYWKTTVEKRQLRVIQSGQYVGTTMLYDTGAERYPTWTANDDVKLESKLTGKARGHSFAMGCSLAESGQAVDMVVGTAKKLCLSFRSLRHGDFPGAARHLLGSEGHIRARTPLSHRDLSSQWLELRYGWEPLLSDLHESMTAFSAVFQRARMTTVSCSLAKRTSGIWTGTSYMTSEYDSEYSKHATLLMKEVLPVPRSLGLLNPLSIAWEVTPYSFVADWFIPIGTYLDNLNVIPSISNDVVYTVVKRCLVQSSGKQYYVGGKNQQTFTSFTRSAPGSFAATVPTFKPVIDAASIGHVENALALLTQVFGR